MNKMVSAILAIISDCKPKASPYPNHINNWDEIFTRAEEIMNEHENFLELDGYKPETAAKMLAALQAGDEHIRQTVDSSELSKGILKIKIKECPSGIIFGLRMLFARLFYSRYWTDRNLAEKERQEIDKACDYLLELALAGTLRLPPE